jgi:hypothetical protein
MKANQFLSFLALSSLLLTRVHGAVIEYTADLNGLSEFPPNSSPGTGFADVFFNDSLDTLRVEVTFSGLLGTTTASHIHAATAVPGAGVAGVATTTPTFPGFPLGVTSGTYDRTFDLTAASSFNPAYVSAKGSVANAELALVDALNAGEAYLNIHSMFRPGGEIRGFLVRAPDSVPTLGMLFPAFLIMTLLFRPRTCRA